MSGLLRPDDRGMMTIRKGLLDGMDGIGVEREGGFTLIELLIVMSVMLILMTLAVPQLLKL